MSWLQPTSLKHFFPTHHTRGEKKNLCIHLPVYFTSTLWFCRDPSSTSVYAHGVIVSLTSEFDWLAPACRTNLITCLKLVIVISLNAECLRRRCRTKKCRRNFRKKARRSGTISPLIWRITGGYKRKVLHPLDSSSLENQATPTGRQLKIH